MIVNLHRSYQGQPLPQRRAELYQDICELQLKDRPRARGIDMPLPLAESQQLLQAVALDLMQEVKEPRISAENLNQLIDKHLRKLDTQDPVTSNDLLDKIRDVSELIVKREEEYEFAHLSFQEFLAAKQIKEQEQEQLLLDNWQSQWWRGTILLYAALVNPSTLIRSLITFNNEEATTLALRCLEETPRKIDPEIEAELTSLQSNVQNLLYQPLETYLKNEQWREADEETFKVMLKVADREEQSSLDEESINNFPCEDLRIIDQLWVKYSKGKFGFSIQKEIYESLGGTKEYDENVFQRLSDRVGWRKDDNWVSYSDLYGMTLKEAKQGYLPTPPNYKMFLFSAQVLGSGLWASLPYFVGGTVGLVVLGPVEALVGSGLGGLLAQVYGQFRQRFGQIPNPRAYSVFCTLLTREDL